jgi:hypothetical protein
VTDHQRQIQQDLDALIARSINSRRKLTRIARELSEFWRRVRKSLPKPQ